MTIIIIVIVAIVFFKFITSLNKDNVVLNEQPLSQKFSVIVDLINKSAYNGQGEIIILNKRSFNLYCDGENQIINFQYSTSSLTITWKYKWFYNEIVHSKDFYNVQEISIDGQRRIANQMIAEMSDIIENHSNNLNEEYKKGLSDAAITRMKEMEIEEEENNEKEKQENAEKRKFGYKYEDMIFEIFDNYRILNKDDIIWSMQQYPIQKQKTEEIFNLWIEKELIVKCYKNECYFEVGCILTSARYKLTQSDLTRDKWLELHHKKLQSVDNEYLFYRDAKFLIFKSTLTVGEFKVLKGMESEAKIQVLENSQQKGEYIMKELIHNVELGAASAKFSTPGAVTKPIVSLVQPGILQSDGSLLPDATKPAYFLLHQLGDYPHDIILADF
jgi:hypothetical protein